MKIIKTATILLGILLLLSVVAYFLPIQEILSKLPFVKDFYNNTSISINSKNGTTNIKVNGKDYGQSPVTVSNLSEGEYDIEMTRVSDTQFYDKKEIGLFLERGTEAIIDYEIGPSKIESGYLLYYTKSSSTSTNSGFLTISSNPEKADIYLDGEFFQKGNVNAYSISAKDYELIARYQGYEELKLPIIIRNGYNLNIILTLYPIPTALTK